MGNIGCRIVQFFDIDDAVADVSTKICMMVSRILPRCGLYL